MQPPPGSGAGEHAHGRNYCSERSPVDSTTSPIILSMEVCRFAALDWIVTVRLILYEAVGTILNCTSTNPLSPGAMGFFV
jgi:hypothetical protein